MSDRVKITPKAVDSPSYRKRGRQNEQVSWLIVLGILFALAAVLIWHT